MPKGPLLPTTSFGLPGTGTSIKECAAGLGWSSQMEQYRPAQVEQATIFAQPQEEFYKFEAQGEASAAEEEVAEPTYKPPGMMSPGMMPKPWESLW